MSEAAHCLLSRSHGNANALALAWKANLQERRLQAAAINRRLAALRSLVRGFEKDLEDFDKIIKKLKEELEAAKDKQR